jgi:cytochrome c553
VKRILASSIILVAVHTGAPGADSDAGKKIGAAACAACHGADGVSVNETTPNLAAQRASYLEAQLNAYKDGSRKRPGATSPTAIMSAIATQLSAEDIANVAAYFASLPGAAPGAKSPLLPNIAKTRVTFPEGYKDTFTKYHTINFPATKQVRYYYANHAAVAAAKAGKPLPDGSVLFVEVYAAKLDAENKPLTGADGFFVSDKLLQYTAMASGESWGQDIPEMLRNAGWNYAIFNSEKQLQTSVNQAVCLACHKPLADVSYTFTLKQLSEAK